LNMKKPLKIVVWIVWILAVAVMQSTQASAFVEEPSTANKQLVMVIDDFGNDMAGTDEILNLPIPLTIAVMPFLPTTKRDAHLAHEKGHDVLVHIPMQPVKGKKSWLGPDAITSDLTNDEVRNRVIAAIDDVPFAIGINNHMGSKVTADERIMSIIVQVCKERGLIFLDSRTTNKSVIGKLAAKMGVPHAENQIFLDEVYSMHHISKQMEKVKKQLSKHNQCIVIGHVGPPGKKTAAVISRSIPALQKEVQWMTITTMLEEQKVKFGPSY
jgi:polysaccharide deacetylase 2 family uncharacterized protein YibQ